MHSMPRRRWARRQARGGAPRPQPRIAPRQAAPRSCTTGAVHAERCVNRGPTRTTCACTSGPQKCLLLWGPTARGERRPRTEGKVTHFIEGFYPVPAARAGKSLLLRVRAQAPEFGHAHTHSKRKTPALGPIIEAISTARPKPRPLYGPPGRPFGRPPV